MPMVYSDPDSSDHQRAYIGRAVMHEHQLNQQELKELEKSVQVCA